MSPQASRRSWLNSIGCHKGRHESERNEGEYRRAHGDHHGTESDYSRIEHRLLERFAFRMSFFNEIEQHDVADDHSDQTYHAEESP